MWKSSSLSWPNTAQLIQTNSETVTNQVATEMSNAVGRLTPLLSDAAFSRHPLSVDAEKLLGLRGDLQALLTQGQVLTASPHQFQVGEKLQSGCYLNPQKAVEVLANKLNDQVDKYRPAASFYCVAVMLSASQLNQFASQLSEFTQVFNIPDWGVAARQASSLSTNDVDKFHQAAAISQPRFKPQAHLNVNPLRELLKRQGAQLATLESLADDKANVVEKLQSLALKRERKLTVISQQINALKNFKSSAYRNSLYSMALQGNAQSVAAQLKQAPLPNNHQYTIMSLLISSKPLTFFEELLCSA